MIAGDSFSYKDNSKLFQKISSYASLDQKFLYFNFNKIFPKMLLFIDKELVEGKKLFEDRYKTSSQIFLGLVG